MAAALWRGSVSRYGSLRTIPTIAQRRAHTYAPGLSAFQIDLSSTNRYSKYTVRPAAAPRHNMLQSRSMSSQDATSTVPLPATPLPVSVPPATPVVVDEHPELLQSPVALVCDFLTYLHTVGGLPWWASIAACTLLIRICTLPVAVASIRNARRMANFQPELQKLRDKLTKVMADSAQNRTPIQAQMDFQRETQELMAKHNVSPWKSFGTALTQIPIFMSFFFGIKSMCAHKELYPGIDSGGIIPWVTDLSQADPYYVLPILSASAMLFNFEKGSEGVQSSDQGAKFKYLMRGFCALMVPITASMPSGIFMYWLPSNIFSMAQMFVLKSKPVRRFFDMPDKPGEETAYPEEKLKRKAVYEIEKPVTFTGPPRKKTHADTPVAPSLESASAGETRASTYQFRPKKNQKRR
eukprot:GILK01001322.1.p1 GENE.GILK01001322.1~~GILK01001322.1.p1  ORF type:complete len:424 (-),score=42.10 GILK01001322.1:58-1284(-)